MLRQRVFGIAAGYPDVRDADLRLPEPLRALMMALWRPSLTTIRLSAAAIACALLGVAACLLDWAVAPYPLQGTDAPLHGVWVMGLAGLGAGITAVGVSYARAATRSGQAEKLLRGAGVVLGLGVLVVLMDARSELFQLGERGAGLWLTGIFLLAGCLAATFASMRLPPGIDDELRPEDVVPKEDA